MISQGGKNGVIFKRQLVPLLLLFGQLDIQYDPALADFFFNMCICKWCTISIVDIFLVLGTPNA